MKQLGGSATIPEHDEHRSSTHTHRSVHTRYSFSHTPAFLASQQPHITLYSHLCIPGLVHIGNPRGRPWSKEWVHDSMSKLVKIQVKTITFRLHSLRLRSLDSSEDDHFSFSFSPLCHPWSCVYWKSEFCSHLRHSLALCTSQDRLDPGTITNVPTFSVAWHNKSSCPVLATCPLWASWGGGRAWLYSMQ